MGWWEINYAGLPYAREVTEAPGSSYGAATAWLSELNPSQGASIAYELRPDAGKMLGVRADKSKGRWVSEYWAYGRMITEHSLFVYGTSLEVERQGRTLIKLDNVIMKGFTDDTTVTNFGVRTEEDAVNLMKSKTGSTEIAYSWDGSKIWAHTPIKTQAQYEDEGVAYY